MENDSSKVHLSEPPSSSCESGIILFGLTTFVLGSLICTVAPSSRIFILGRAVCGLGISAVNSATLTTITRLFPSNKRSIWLSLAGTSQAIGLSCAPVIGGALIDRFGWRACFGINLPLCPLLIIFTAFFLEDPVRNPNYELPFFEKLRRLDVPGTILTVPAITCLLMGLQWGGIKYGWPDTRIIVLFVVFVCLAVALVYLQYRLGDQGTIPPRIIRKRSVLAGTLFDACTNGILATTEYYMSIYWQGVRDESATSAGLLGLSMIVGLGVSGMLAGFAISRIGYFTPFMVLTSILTSIASGLLTTLTLDESKAKIIALQGFLEVAIGIGNIGPIQAIALLPISEIPIGMAIPGFGGGMGSALFISVSATLFQNRLAAELSRVGVDATTVTRAGLSEIRNVIGSERLKSALAGYDKAVVQTFYLPLGLALLTWVGSLSMRWGKCQEEENMNMCYTRQTASRTGFEDKGHLCDV